MLRNFANLATIILVYLQWTVRFIRCDQRCSTRALHFTILVLIRHRRGNESCFSTSLESLSVQLAKDAKLWLRLCRRACVASMPYTAILVPLNKCWWWLIRLLSFGPRRFFCFRTFQVGHAALSKITVPVYAALVCLLESVGHAQRALDTREDCSSVCALHIHNVTVQQWTTIVLKRKAEEKVTIVSHFRCPKRCMTKDGGTIVLSWSECIQGCSGVR